MKVSGASRRARLSLYDYIFHRQTVADTALVVEALTAFAGPLDALEIHHERRAWKLISTLADDLSMTPSERLRIDTHQLRTP